MFDLAPFQKELNTFIEEEVPREWKRRVIDIICFLHDAISSSNPVAGRDPNARREKNVPGGFSKNNWLVDTSISSKVFGSRENPPKGLSDDDIRDKLAILRNKNPEIVWIYNNVRYVRYLEDGSSQQAPYGFISLSIEETRAYMDIYLRK